MSSNIDEEIIKMVRSHIELYDLSHPKYMDSVFKDNIWCSIGNEINLTGKVCKTRWNNIRDNYRKSIKKTTSGQAFKKLKKYKYDDQLQFLKPHLQERDTLGNLKNMNNDDLENSYNDSEDEVENVNTVQNIEISGNTETGVEDQLLQTPEPQPVRKISQKRTSKIQESASSTLMKFIMQKRENNAPNTTQTHSVDAFLAGLSSTLKLFTPYYLNIVKSKIFSIVQEYEMQMIVDEEKKKTSFMTSCPTPLLPSPQQFNLEFNQNSPSNTAVQLNHRSYPSIQLQKEMLSPNVSNYSSAPSSPQVSQIASFSNTRSTIQTPQNTRSPTTFHYSSFPPSSQYSLPPPFSFLNKNISSNITQNHTHLQKTQNIIFPTLSSSQSQFDHNILNETNVQPQQERNSNLSSNSYASQSHKLNKNKHTTTFKQPQK